MLLILNLILIYLQVNPKSTLNLIMYENLLHQPININLPSFQVEHLLKLLINLSLMLTYLKFSCYFHIFHSINQNISILLLQFLIMIIKILHNSFLLVVVHYIHFFHSSIVVVSLFLLLLILKLIKHLLVQ